MLRMTKQADYGIVLLTYMGLHAEALHNARDLGRQTGIPLPMVSKILKALARGGVLTSQRGTKGGYTLARPTRLIRVSEIIQALEGPVAITECVGNLPSSCTVERLCPVRPSWVRINQVINDALSNITLEELLRPTSAKALAADPPLSTAAGRTPLPIATG
jgi:FeS assembly SUF system regulator